MKINSAYKVRKVATTYLVVCQGKIGADMTHVINLNSTAVELWKEFENKDFTLDDIAAYLVNTYGIEEDRAMGDACNWLDALKGCDVIVE